MEWGKIRKTTEQGGQGIMCFAIQNEALLAKHLWRVLSYKETSFVHRIMRSKIINLDKCKLFASG